MKCINKSYVANKRFGRILIIILFAGIGLYLYNQYSNNKQIS